MQNKPSCIILHHAAAKKCTIHDIHQWHLNIGWLGCGYHFFISKDGMIYRGRPQETNGSHTIGANAKSIGVCIEGNYNEEAHVPDAQMKALVQLAKHIALPVRHHKEFSSTDCPGKNFPWDSFVRMVESNDEKKSVDQILSEIIDSIQELRDSL